MRRIRLTATAMAMLHAAAADENRVITGGNPTQLPDGRTEVDVEEHTFEFLAAIEPPDVSDAVNRLCNERTRA